MTECNKVTLKHICFPIQVLTRPEGGGDSGEKGFQELLQRTHGQNQGGGWKQKREVGLSGVGGGGEKMQTTVINSNKNV